MTGAPAVSVVVPAYRGTLWIGAAIESALAQTFGDLEVVVVDDASGDGTAEAARAFRDERVRVVENERNLGLVGNWNRSASLSRAPLVKYLFQDDLLAPTCLERLVGALRERPEAGMAFSRREVLLDDPDDPAAKTWWERFGEVHARYGPLPAFSPARALFEPWASQRFHGNWVGEPTCVLLRREALARTGLFHVRMLQIADMELWGRLAFHFGVAFVDEALCSFRVHAASATRRNSGRALDWLDRLWLFEGLLADAEIAAAHPEIRRWRRHEWRHVVKRARAARTKDARLTPRKPAPGLRAYVAWRLARPLGRAQPLHPPLEPVEPTGSPGGRRRTAAT